MSDPESMFCAYEIARGDSVGQIACELCDMTLFKGDPDVIDPTVLSITQICGGYTPPPWEGEWVRSTVGDTTLPDGTQRMGLVAEFRPFNSGQ